MTGTPQYSWAKPREIIVDSMDNQDVFDAETVARLTKELDLAVIEQTH